MSPNPSEFIEHLRMHGYHPRSDKHSNALAMAIAHDLVGNGPLIGARSAAGELVYALNFTLRAGRADWNVDLVFGPPALGEPRRPDPPATIREALPSAVQIAVELKSVMTEHRKAVKNRKRDLEAHHEHVHNYNGQAIAGGVFVVNCSGTFRSPLRSEATSHRNVASLVEHCVSELRSVSGRSDVTGYGLDAKCALVVETDNVRLEDARYLTTPPAPVLGDPLHYDCFIRTLCEQYQRRWP